MLLTKDKNGKTELEFLREYDATRYFRPSVTVDAILYRKAGNGLDILYIERGGHPFLGMYAFPGGFVEEDESCEAAVYRELREETGITDVKLKQLVTVSTPGRDPRYRNITVAYCGVAPTELVPCAGDDAASAEWLHAEQAQGGTIVFTKRTGESFECKLELARDPFGEIDLNATRITTRGAMAFDHAKITAYLMERIFGLPHSKGRVKGV